MEYRRDLNAQTWHFCQNCSQWPKEFDVVRLYDLKPNAELCNECFALQQQGQCTDLDSLSAKMGELACKVGEMHPEDPRCVPLMKELSHLVALAGSVKKRH